MRLFYGVSFSEKDIISIARLSGSIDRYITHGKAVREANYHLTLSFLGEVEQRNIEYLSNLLTHLPNEPLSLTARHLGLFAKRRSNTLYLQIEEEPTLFSLQQQLEQLLIRDGFITKGGRYRPHITLFRQVTIPILPMIESIELTPYSIALFHSHRVNDLLTYSILSQRRFEHG